MVAVAALASGCLVSPVMHFGGGKTRSQVEHETVTEMTPPALAPDGAWHGAVRTATIRVYADDDYRGQNARWQQTFEQVLADANQVLAADYGVRLVPEFHTWDRHEPAAELADGLAELAKLDAGDGDGVLAVVGLTSSMPLTRGDFEQIGMAELGGRHLIVRGYADVEERAAFARSFDSIDDDDKEAMFQARRRHRNATAFLHELGHDLGAPHSATSDTIMSPMYSLHATSFDPDSRALILKALDARLNPTAAPPPAAAPPRPDLPDPSWLERTAANGHTVLIIGVDRRGGRIVGGNTLDDATLDGLLAEVAHDDPTTEIEVHAMPGATAGAVQGTLEHVRKAGLEHVRAVILR